MNGAVVMFLVSTSKVKEVVEKGIGIHGTFTPVSPLVNPATTVTISNVPPFIQNDMLAAELLRFGQLVSPIKMLSFGCKSEKLKHIVCHKRQVFRILNELSLSFPF